MEHSRISFPIVHTLLVVYVITYCTYIVHSALAVIPSVLVFLLFLLTLSKSALEALVDWKESVSASPAAKSRLMAAWKHMKPS